MSRKTMKSQFAVVRRRPVYAVFLTIFAIAMSLFAIYGAIVAFWQVVLLAIPWISYITLMAIYYWKWKIVFTPTQIILCPVFHKKCIYNYTQIADAYHFFSYSESNVIYIVFTNGKRIRISSHYASYSQAKAMLVRRHSVREI